MKEKLNVMLNSKGYAIYKKTTKVVIIGLFVIEIVAGTLSLFF